MALGMTKLTNQSIISAESVATSALEWAATAINAGSGEIFEGVTLQVSVTFNGSATGNALLHVRYSADDGTTKDDIYTYARTIEVDAGNTVVFSHVLPNRFDYAEIGIENEDSSFTLTYTAKYEGTKITGMA